MLKITHLRSEAWITQVKVVDSRTEIGLSVFQTELYRDPTSTDTLSRFLPDLHPGFRMGGT